MPTYGPFPFPPKPLNGRAGSSSKDRMTILHRPHSGYLSPSTIAG
uniref:Uncharacterized protein n=1 Tax=Anguilla anguilla TaxID=7936 RepID=A0A0E9T3Q4_ANGAN